MNIADYYQVEGQGPPLVFIHGSFATLSSWKKIIAPFSPYYRCIAIKLPGHCGLADPTDFAAPTVQTELAIIEQVINSLTHQPIHLIGHSYGGVVALALALKGSVEIAQLSLFEPVATWVLPLVGDTAMQRRVDDFLIDYRHAVSVDEDNACARVIDFWNGDDSFAALPTAIKQTMALLTANNIRHWDICTQSEYSINDLQALLVPTRLVIGEASNPVAQAIAAHLADLIPHSKRYRIAAASHSMINTHADFCRAILNDSEGLL